MHAVVVWHILQVGPGRNYLGHVHASLMPVGNSTQ